MRLQPYDPEPASMLSIKPRNPLLARPWRSGNHFVLLSEGKLFFDRMIESIERANQFVLLEMYLVESGDVTTRFIDALARARARGVAVFALFDAFGALQLNVDDRLRLQGAGVNLSLYNSLRWRNWLSNLTRDHRKLLLIDDQIAFVGGAGLTDEFVAHGSTGSPWRDMMLEIHGSVLLDWHQMFENSWHRSGALPAPPRCGQPQSLPQGMSGRVVASDGWHQSELADSVARRINTATKRVWAMSAYFLPSHRFRLALRRAARRGADVRLFVPGPLTDHPWVRHAARRFYGKLLRNGVRIYEYQPQVLHAKMILCDDWVTIGSSNLDRWGFKWNLEANQEVDDPAFAQEVAATFEGDRARSLELNRREWRRRSRRDRAREFIAGFLDRAFERFKRPRRHRDHSA